MEQVLQQFCLDGTPVSCEPFGNGHINRTFRVTCSSGRVYTLQRINRVAFRHPEELIENIDAVSRFIAKKNTGLEMIRLCTARDGRKYAVDAQGEFWRAYDYISGGLSLEAPRDCNDFYQAAVAFGKFQQALADFPAATLHETIPRFTTPRTGSASCALQWRPTPAAASGRPGRSLRSFPPVSRSLVRSAGCCAAARCRCG